MRPFQSASTINSSAASWGSRFRQVLRRAWFGYWRWWTLRVTIRRLQELDDHLLKDIGVDRSEIESIAHTKGIERMRRYDSITGHLHRP